MGTNTKAQTQNSSGAATTNNSTNKKNTKVFDAGALIKAQNDLEKKIRGDYDKEIGKKYIFGKPWEIKYEDVRFDLSEYRDTLKDKGYSVCVYEDIDLKDVSSKSKFIIKIEDSNGTYVDIDYFEYKEKCLDYTFDEYKYISGFLEKLSGRTSKQQEKAAGDIVKYLSYLRYFKEEHVKTYNNVGWAKYDGKDIFKYDWIYTKKDMQIKGMCKNSIKEALYTEGIDYEGKAEWRKHLFEVMDYSAKAALIIAAGATGIFRQRLTYTKETNINMNIVGERATGKSTICHFALSLFGNPAALEGSFTDTDNAMELIRSERPVIPYILDERMLKTEGSSEKAKRQTILMDIFREYEGKVKERAGKQYEDSSGKRTYSPIISSSVEPMLDVIYSYSDLGQYRRFIELHITGEKDLFKSKEQAERTEEMAYNYYGFGVEMLMKYIFYNKMEDGEEIKERFDYYNELVEKILVETEKMEHINGIKSSSKRFALILLSYEMLFNALTSDYEDVIGYHYVEEITENNGTKKINIDDRVCAENIQKIIKILVDNVVDKMKRVKENINAKENIVKFVKEHKGFFQQQTASWDGKGACLGNLRITDEHYIIDLKKTLPTGWLLVSKRDFSDKELQNYIDLIERYNNSSNKEEQNEIKTKMTHMVEELVGDICKNNFKNYISKDRKGIRYEEKGGKSRLDRLFIERKDIEAEDEKSAEGEEK